MKMLVENTPNLLRI